MEPIKIIEFKSFSKISDSDIRQCVAQHQQPPTKKGMATTEAGTKHLYYVGGTWVDSGKQVYTT